MLIVFILSFPIIACGDDNDELSTPNDHEWVDLGLPSGTLWATCNIGANRPEEYGDYFAWGETVSKEAYSDDNYKWPYFTKYNDADKKTELELEDDAAFVNWGSLWRMPTEKQFSELFNSCFLQWTQLHGVNGLLVTSPNGKTLFLPAAGHRLYSSHVDAGSLGFYWSLTRYPGDSIADGFCYPVHLEFKSDEWYTCTRPDRTGGHTVRAVRASVKEIERQNPGNQSEYTIYRNVEQMPQFPGGVEELMRYIKKNIHYIPLAANAQGSIIVEFIVDRMGKVGEVRVVHSLTKELDDELVRVVKTLPKFTPGCIGRNVVSVWYTLPVTFRPGVEVCYPFMGPQDENGIYKSVENAPLFPGGDAALMKHIETHIKYPPAAAKNNIQGIVVVQFVVEMDGKVSEVNVVRSVNEDLDKEAVRVAKALPKFTPGRQNGQPVRVWYTLPVKFKL